MAARAWRVAAAVFLLAGCATGGRRPRLVAAPEAVAILLKRPADSTVILLEARARAQGLRVERFSPREGYLETGWYDVARHATVPPPFSRLDSIVKFRFFADPSQGKTRLVAECMRRIAWDPSLPPRELERMVPAGHPGLGLMDSVLVVVREAPAEKDSTRS